MSTLDYRLGIDVGGTNADAVILDCSDQVRAKVKVPPTLVLGQEPVHSNERSSPASAPAGIIEAGRKQRQLPPIGTGGRLRRPATAVERPGK